MRRWDTAAGKHIALLSSTQTHKRHTGQQRAVQQCCVLCAVPTSVTVKVRAMCGAQDRSPTSYHHSLLSFGAGASELHTCTLCGLEEFTSASGATTRKSSSKTFTPTLEDLGNDCAVLQNTRITVISLKFLGATGITPNGLGKVLHAFHQTALKPNRAKSSACLEVALWHPNRIQFTPPSLRTRASGMFQA